MDFFQSSQSTVLSEQKAIGQEFSNFFAWDTSWSENAKIIILEGVKGHFVFEQNYIIPSSINMSTEHFFTYKSLLFQIAAELFICVANLIAPKCEECN